MSQAPDYSHQEKAVDALWEEFKTEGRGTVLAACGTGKTRKQSKLMRRFLDSGATHMLVLAPTIDLVYQNAKDYREQLGDDVRIIAVSSDSSSGDSDGIPTLDTSEQLHEAMTGAGSPVLFVSTYDSAHKLGDAQRLGADIIPFQSGILDEGHTAAGEKNLEAKTAYALDDANLLIEKRSIFTATPRLTKKALTSSSAISMSDQSLFGRVVYNFPYSAAREAGIVSDYSIFVPVVTKAEVQDLMKQRGLDEKAAQNLLSEIATLKVMEETGQSRFISYHNRIAGSKAFSKAMDKALSGKGFHVAHVDGKTPREERQNHVHTMRTGDKYLISNADIFREGTDAQALQGAVIVDASSSQVKIVQTISRPMRTDPNDPGKVASIVVPLLVDDATPEAILKAAESSQFKTVIEVADAMRHTDNLFDQDVRKRSYDLGAGNKLNKKRASGSKFKIIGADVSVSDRQRLSDAVTMVAIEKLKDPFSFTLGEYHTHLKKFGAAPTKATNAKLYLWAEQQRRLHRDRKIDPIHAASLDETPGWSWLPARTQTKTLVETLEAFRARLGRTPQLPSGEEASRRTKHPTAEQILAEQLADAERYGARIQNTAPRDASTAAGKLFFALREGGFPLYGERGRKPLKEDLSSVRGMLGLSRTSKGDMVAVFIPNEGDGLEIPIGGGLTTPASKYLSISHPDPDELARILKLAETPNIVTLSVPEGQRPRLHPGAGVTHHLDHVEVTAVASGLDAVLREEDGPNACAERQHYWNFAPSDMEKIREALDPSIYVRALPGQSGAARDLPIMEVTSAKDAAKTPRRYEIAPGRLDVAELRRRSPGPDYFLSAHLKKTGAGRASILEFRARPPRRFHAKLAGSPSHLVVALHDWKLSHKQDPCTQASIARGKIDPNETAPNLGPEAPMTIAQMRDMIEMVQDTHRDGLLAESTARMLENAPGFSFVETSRPRKHLSAAADGIAARHGRDIFSDPRAREGDTGLANTLKVIDHIAANAHGYPEAAEDLKHLSDTGLLVSIQAVNRQRRSQSSQQNVFHSEKTGQYHPDSRRQAAMAGR